MYNVIDSSLFYGKKKNKKLLSLVSDYNRMNTMDEIFVEIDNKNEIGSDIDKCNNNKIDNNENPHHGKPITMIEVSPNGNYLVTYSKKDHSIVGWNVNDIDEGQLEPEPNHRHIVHNYYNVNIHISVSNDKKIAYIYDNRLSM